MLIVAMNSLPPDHLALRSRNSIRLSAMSPAMRTRCARRALRQRWNGPTSSFFPKFFLPAIRRKIWCSSRLSRRRAGCRGGGSRAGTADGGPAILLGTPWPDGGKLYNAVALLDGGRIAALRYKVDLPNYGVFDEKRVFARDRCQDR